MPRGGGKKGPSSSSAMRSMVSADAIGSGQERARVTMRKSANLIFTVTVRAGVLPRL